MNFELKPFSYCQKPKILFATKRVTTRGEQRWELQEKPVTIGRDPEKVREYRQRNKAKNRKKILEKDRRNRVERRARCIRQGLCVQCQTASVDHKKYSRCEPCRQHREALAKIRKQARRDENICFKCGDVESPNGKMCRECLDIQRVKLRNKKGQL